MPVIKVYKKFPPVVIPDDGSKIGIDGLKNIIDISVEAKRRHKKHLEMKKGIFKRINGWFLGAWYGGVALKDLLGNAQQLWDEVQDLDYKEIELLVYHIKTKHHLDSFNAKRFFEVLKNILEVFKDGKVTLDEIQNIPF